MILHVFVFPWCLSTQTKVLNRARPPGVFVDCTWVAWQIHAIGLELNLQNRGKPPVWVLTVDPLTFGCWDPLTFGCWAFCKFPPRAFPVLCWVTHDGVKSMWVWQLFDSILCMLMNSTFRASVEQWRTLQLMYISSFSGAMKLFMGFRLFCSWVEHENAVIQCRKQHDYGLGHRMCCMFTCVIGLQDAVR